MVGKDITSAVATFGAACRAKLANPAISGAPEDQLRGPLETFIADLSEISGLPAGAVSLVGETTLAHLKTRPDYAVAINKALIGFLEVKAPGKGADPRKFTDLHDKEQWAKLKSLPNLIYTDGNAFSLWRDGKLFGGIVHLQGDVETAGAKLQAPPALLPLVSDFLRWTPIPPRNARQLAEITARLCRLLRDEVVEQMGLGNPGLTALAQDWRKLLFPEANDAQFADGYAQAVTFGLLVARAREISLENGIDSAAQELRKTNSLIGTALRLLTDDAANQRALETSLGTLRRVLDAVHWPTVSKDKPEAWLYFYEDFLEVYDNTLRKRTGSYYTPPEVVSAMVRLVDEALRGPLFERPAGFASSDVVVADPAVGTGTFLLGVLRRIAATVAADQGEGAVRGAIEAAAQRVIGFELQFGPFAVAQLRIIAEMQALMGAPGEPAPSIPDLRLFITDTLGNPFIEEDTLVQSGPIAKSRRDANAVKRNERITVVIGNPPYKVDAAGQGGWIEEGSSGRPSALDLWLPPAEWGVGASAKHLKNLYVFFWRWATWKVFGSGFTASTGLPASSDAGIVCFITAAGFLNGPGFQKMRDDLRRNCSSIWVIDCSPEGHQPDVPTRIFQGVQQPVCIVLAARQHGKSAEKPAPVRFRALAKGRREGKFKALAALSIHDSGWSDGSSGWRDPFLPRHGVDWAAFLPLPDLFHWFSPGVQTHRTWVIAPDVQSLERRWTALQKERYPERKAKLFHADRDRTLDRSVQVDLGPYRTRNVSVGSDEDPVVPPVRYAFRSFNRQWVIPDHRLLSQARSKIWAGYSSKQVYLTALAERSPTSGPAITFTELIPDRDHYKGSFGGRVFPLWRDRAATEPNVRPELLAFLADLYHFPATAEDMTAYLAALMAHPAFTARFASDLVRPGLRVPLTADPVLFAEAVALGREVVWLHSTASASTILRRGGRKARRACPRTKRPPSPSAAPSPARPSRCRTPWTTKPRTTGCVSARVLSRTSRPPCGPTKSPASRCSGTGSAIAAATVLAPSLATAVRHRRSIPSSRTIGSPNTPPTCSTCCTSSVVLSCWSRRRRTSWSGSAPASCSAPMNSGSREPFQPTGSMEAIQTGDKRYRLPRLAVRLRARSELESRIAPQSALQAA